MAEDVEAFMSAVGISSAVLLGSSSGGYVAQQVAILSPNNLWHWLALGLGVLVRRKRVPRMETYRAERVEILSNRAQPRQLDGDLIEPGKSMRVQIKPKALLLCVPRPASDPELTYDVSATREAAKGVRAAAEEAE